MAPLLSCPEISRQRSRSTGPINCMSSSTFWRFFSDLLYICNCHGASDSVERLVEEVFIESFSSLVDLTMVLSIVDLMRPGRVRRPQFLGHGGAVNCDAGHTDVGRAAVRAITRFLC